MAVKSVRTAAAEEKLGGLHDKLTDLMIRKLEAIEELLEHGVDGDGNRLDPNQVIQLAELNPIVNWLHKNDIGPAIHARDKQGEGETEMQRQLREARERAKARRTRSADPDDEVPSILEGGK